MKDFPEIVFKWIQSLNLPIKIVLKNSLRSCSSCKWILIDDINSNNDLMDVKVLQNINMLEIDFYCHKCKRTPNPNNLRLVFWNSYSNRTNYILEISDPEFFNNLERHINDRFLIKNNGYSNFQIRKIPLG